MDKDSKILSFEELKKKKELLEKNIKDDNIDKNQINSLLGQMSDTDREQIKTMMEAFGLGLDENMKSQIEKVLNAKSIDDLIENASSDFFDPGMLGKISEEAKKANIKYKSEYRYYRDFSQWQTVYKPYNLEKFLLIEQVKAIANELNLELQPNLSKNQLISEVKPILKQYLEIHLGKFDEERMNLLGSIIANGGVLYLQNRLTEFEEKQIDYLGRLGFVFRINESSKKALVIPQEMLNAIMEVDFRKFMLTQKINSVICNSICGMASLYGVIPTKEGKNKVWKLVEEYNYFASREEYESYFDVVVADCFSTSIVSRGYHSVAGLNKEYIFHPMVGFVDEFYKSQLTSKHNYKEFSYEELKEEGTEEYYQDSIQLNTAWEILSAGKPDDERSTKSLIYTFSKMEFEPQMVIALLETMYEIPIGSKYELLMDSLRAISKRTAKWVLKGYLLGEDTEEGKTQKSENYDPSKIINFDFHKK